MLHPQDYDAIKSLGIAFREGGLYCWNWLKHNIVYNT